MTNSALQTFYKGWEDYQALLIKAIAPLSQEQLTLRAGPELRSIGEIAAHMIGARARWFINAIGEGGQNITPMSNWDRPGQPVPNAAELINGLQATWHMIKEAVNRWPPEEFARSFEVESAGTTHTFTRQWIIWHLIEHDLHHGGEISLTLGARGMQAPDL